MFVFSEELREGSKYKELTAVQAKAKVYLLTRPILKEMSIANIEGLIGSHLIWKFASTYVRGNGVSKDNKDHRGHWQTNNRQSNRYDDI